MFKSTLRSMLFVLSTAAVLSLGAASNASAHGYYQPHCTYKTITVWEYCEVPVTIYVTVYDNYGCAHEVPKTIYKTVKVPVTKTIKVCY